MSIASTAARWVRIIGWVWLVACLSLASLPLFAQPGQNTEEVSEKLASDPVWAMLNTPSDTKKDSVPSAASGKGLTKGQTSGMLFMAGVGFLGFTLSRVLAAFLSRIGRAQA